MSDIQIDTKQIKNTLIVSNITSGDISDAIVNFNNGKLGIIDGSLSQACAHALNSLLPKNVSTLPVAAMESHTLCFGKYKPLHQYACEQYQNNNELLGMLYVYPEMDTNGFDDLTKLNETARLMTDEQKKSSVIYCSKESQDSCKQDASQWAMNNGFGYTESLESAVSHWSGNKKLKIQAPTGEDE